MVRSKGPDCAGGVEQRYTAEVVLEPSSGFANCIQRCGMAVSCAAELYKKGSQEKMASFTALYNAFFIGTAFS